MFDNEKIIQIFRIIKKIFYIYSTGLLVPNLSLKQQMDSLNLYNHQFWIFFSWLTYFLKWKFELKTKVWADFVTQRVA